MKIYISLKRVSVLLFMIAPVVIYGQFQKEELVLTKKYEKLADHFLAEKKHDSAIVYFRKALTIYKEKENWVKAISCLNMISKIQLSLSLFDKSIQNSTKALKLSNAHLKKYNKEVANSYDNIGTYFLKKNNFKKSLSNYEEAFSIRKRIFPENHSEMIYSYYNLGYTFMTLSKVSKAFNYFDKAIKVIENTKDLKDYAIVGMVYNAMGYLHYMKGRYDKSEKYCKKFLGIYSEFLDKNHIQIGRSNLVLGIAYRMLLKFEKSIFHYKEAMSIFQSNNDVFSQATIYNNIGNVYRANGEYNKAFKYYNKNLNILLKISSEENPHVAGVYNNMGLIFIQKKDYGKAIHNFKKALYIRKKLYGGKHISLAQTYHNLGLVYQNMESYSQSLSYYYKSLNIYQENYSNHHPSTLGVFLNIANIYTIRKKYTKALHYYNHNINELKKAPNSDVYLTLVTYHQMAELFYEQGQYEKAIHYYEEAIKVNSINNKKALEKSVQKRYQNLNALYLSILGKSKALLNYYKESGDIKYLNKTFNNYYKIDTLIIEKQSSLLNYKDKINLAHTTQEVYQNAVKAYQLGYQHTGNSKYLTAAFHYSEKSKAATLQYLLEDADIKSFAGVSPALVSLEKELKTDSAFYTSQLQNMRSKAAPDSTKIQYFEDQLFMISQRQDSLNEAITTRHPRYFDLKNQSKPLTIQTIQKQLPAHTSLLEFMVADSVTYAFVVRKDTLVAQKLHTPTLKTAITRFQKKISKKNMPAYKEEARVLYRQLIAPIKQHLQGKELIIIPDGVLWHCNFDLLLTSDEPSNDPKKLPYLLKEYAISYANAAHLLFRKRSKTRPEKKLLPQCLAFSFSDSTQQMPSNKVSFNMLRDAGNDLPGTREEIKAIANIVDGQYYYGVQAVETNFKKNASHYNIVHLALHGEVDHEDPDHSKLYFTKSKDTIEDGLLYSHELFALDIPAELTVLSACYTGTGTIAKGEGIMSLGNAFQYAGTKSLLLSSWEVPDQTTPQLMKSFYINLKEGMNKSRALQKAKLQYLTNADITRSHPFFWGGFYLLGDPSPVDLYQTTSLWWWGLGLLTLIVTGIAFRLFRKQR